MELRNLLIPPCLRGFESDAARFDVLIEKGLVAHIKPAAAAINSVAEGTLTSCPVDAHVHLDKTYVVDKVGAAEGDLGKAIALMAQHRSRWSASDIASRMERALLDAYQHGTRAMRTHLDWPEAGAPKSLAVFEALRAAWATRISLQCVSLASLEVFDDLAAGEAMAQALARVNQAPGTALLGAFVYRNERIQAKLQRVFDLAAKHNLALDFHVDEGLDVDATGLQTIAELTIQNGFQGKVSCGHCCSLSVQPLGQALATLQLCKEAGITLIALPSTNLYLQGAWDATPVERGITRLKEAAAQSIPAVIATDNVADGFFPYGSYDLLDSFALGVQAAHLSPPDAWLSAITTAPAQALGLPWDGKIAVGCPADLVLLAARTAHELVTPAGRQRRVIRAGQFI